MKKGYVKPEVYCRNYETGRTVATSDRYKKYAEVKVDKLISSGEMDVFVSGHIMRGKRSCENNTL